MGRTRLSFLYSLEVVTLFYVPATYSFVIQSRNDRIGFHESQSISIGSRCYQWDITATHRAASKQRENVKLFSSNGTNGNYDNDSDELNYSGFNNGNYLDQIGGDRTDDFQQRETNDDPTSSTPVVSQNPDRAMSIVSELKANAALFAAFAFGSLNLPGTLTVSESKVTSVTTSLSISRPLPNSDLIRTFVVLDISTLCLMICCVAASQLLIYRLTDGSYEDVDENYNSQINNFDNSDGSRERRNSRYSALGRLVTTYRNEFTVARLTFDLGLVTLLLAVGVRSLAIFDEDIVVPVTIVIGATAVFLAVEYFTTYLEVFRTAENLPEIPLFSILFSFLKNSKNESTEGVESNYFLPRIVLPISLVSVGLGLFFTLGIGSDSSESNLSRLGPYDVTSGATKLKVVTEKIDAEKGRNSQRNGDKNRSLNVSKKARAKAELEKSEAEAAKKKAAEAEAKKKVEEEAKKKAEEETRIKAEEEAKKKAEEEAKKKTEEEIMKKLEKEAKRKAEEEAAAASAAAKAKVEAALEAAKIKPQEEAAAVASAATTT